MDKRIVFGCIVVLTLFPISFAGAKQLSEQDGTVPVELWTKTFGGPGNDAAIDVIETAGGGYLLAGHTESFGAGSSDMWLVKTDSNGNEQWNKTFGGAGEEGASTVIETAGGGYLLAGYTKSFGAGSSDMWLVKTDSNGNEQWNATFGGTDKEEVNAMIETAGGGYLLAGRSNSFGMGGPDFWLVKTDSNGNEQWNKTFGGTSFECAWALIETSDGGYLLTGWTGSSGAGQGDFWLVKTDSSGNELWNTTFGGTGWELAEELIETAGGGYLLAGTTDSFGAGDRDAWLVKTDDNGTEQWNKTIGGIFGDFSNGIIETSDGGYLLTVHTFSYRSASGDNLLIKLDNNGNGQWNLTSGGSSGDDFAWDLIGTADGGYLLAGQTGSSGAGGDDGWLVKLGTPTNGQVPGFLFIPLASAVIILSRRRKPGME